jgi:hypothetical protein
MIRGTKSGWTAMTLLGLLVGAANADDGGRMQISDSPPQRSQAQPAPATNGAPAPTTGTDAAVGACSPGGGDDVGRCRLCGCLGRILAYNPAAGFRPPQTIPIDRDAVIYHQYWPAKWYGQPGWRMAPSFPMVYMPTDTTQLGVYYARVPQWLPNPRMYPRPPRPDQWNRRVVMADHPATGGVGIGLEVGQPVQPGEPVPDAVGSPAPPPAMKSQPAPHQPPPQQQPAQPSPPPHQMAPPPAPGVVN